MNPNQRTVIVIGRTGGGKSTVSNVLAGNNLFEESDSSISVTKNHQVEEFTVEDLNIKVVDTVGLGDTAYTEQEVLFKLADACFAVKDGLHQVFFVTRGRFTREEIEVYNLLRTVIFNEDITKYVTIVRSFFRKFDNAEECAKDIEKVKSEQNINSEILASCGYKVLHVDNPEDDDVTREKSRRKLLLHIRNCRELYRPRELNEIITSIEGFMEDKNKLQKQNEFFKEELQKRKDEMLLLQNQMQESERKGNEMINELKVQYQKSQDQHSRDLQEMKNVKKEMEASLERERAKIQEQMRQEEARSRAEMLKLQQQAEEFKRREEQSRQEMRRKEAEAAAQMKDIQQQRDAALARANTGGKRGGGCVLL